MRRVGWVALAGAWLACAGNEATHTQSLPDAALQPIPSAGEAVLRLEPESLTLPRAFVGHSVTVPVLLSHEGHVPLMVGLHVEPPFALEERTVVLEPHEPRTVSVRLLATAPGALDSALTVVSMHPELQVRTLPLRATVEAVPGCTPSSACHESHFDPASGTCVEAPLSRGPCDGEAG
jgi:hypothetical protein